MRPAKAPSSSPPLRTRPSLLLRAPLWLVALAALLPASALGQTRVSVHDGDTLYINGKSYRLASIDAPELEQTCTGSDGNQWPCGHWSRDQLARLIQDGVTCTRVSTDAYGRTVARCQNRRGQDIGGLMVRAGAAIAYLRDGRDYVSEELYARANRSGLWTGTFESPADWRRRSRRQ
jgi:endonuclease YncB( thermonuclease family)